jgi:predicted kinase
MPAVDDGAFIISGIPGAGKTTVSRLLAERLGDGVHIESDELQAWIRSGGLWPNEEPREEADRQLRLRTKNVCLLADSYRQGGFTPVIDDVVIGSRLQEFLTRLESRPVRFVLLTPVIEVAQKRDAERGYKQVFSIWGHLDEVMRRETPSVGLWLDTSEMTADETVEAILARAGEAVLPPDGPAKS